MGSLNAQWQASGEMMRAKFYTNNAEAKKRWEASYTRDLTEYPDDAKRMKSNLEYATKRITEALDNGQVTIGIGTKALEKVFSDGRFKSQFETKSSGGLLDPKVRKIGEAGALEIRTDVKPKERPIYGFLSNNAKDGVSYADRKNVDQYWDNILSVNNFNVNQYGNIRVVLKSEVRDRSTVTIGDSLRTGVLADSVSANSHDLTNMGHSLS